MDKTSRSSINAITTMFLLNIGIVLSVLSLHEIGHVLFGMYVGCEEGRAIIFDTSQEGPYAELYCSDNVNHNIAYMGSILITVAFGSVFLILRKIPQRHLFFVIIGFSILFASLDIAAFTGIEMTQYFSIGLGTLLVIIGEFLTGLAYTEV